MLLGTAMKMLCVWLLPIPSFGHFFSPLLLCLICSVQLLCPMPRTPGAWIFYPPRIEPWIHITWFFPSWQTPQFSRLSRRHSLLKAFPDSHMPAPCVIIHWNQYKALARCQQHLNALCNNRQPSLAGCQHQTKDFTSQFI